MTPTEELAKNVSELIATHRKQHEVTKELMQVILKHLKNPTQNVLQRRALINALEKYLTLGENHADD